jgi:hypothetical protein
MVSGMEFHQQLQKVFEVQALIQDIHPFLKRVFPIAIVVDGRFQIFDAELELKAYFLAKEADTPMPVPQGVRAAFQMEAYDNWMACVVTPDVFDDLDGYVTIFHEFIHCQQFETCEQALKQTLNIARQAQAENDFMWEINHPFPYADVDFIRLYTAFMATAELRLAELIRRQLKNTLNPEDDEYMLWQEWKEGFARYIENEMQRRLGLPENLGGRQPPFSRVAFYAGGANFIRILEQQEPGLVKKIELLFERMLQVGGN